MHPSSLAQPLAAPGYNFGGEYEICLLCHCCRYWSPWDNFLNREPGINLEAGVLIFGAIVIVYMTRIQPRETTRVQKIDLTGDINLEEIRCQSCNAPLSKDDIEIKDGALFVQCGHCGATYQIEEEPKW